MKSIKVLKHIVFIYLSVSDWWNRMMGKYISTRQKNKNVYKIKNKIFIKIIIWFK